MKVAFTESYTDIKDYRGYRLLAVDGPDLHITTDSADTDTYFQTFFLACTKKNNRHRASPHAVSNSVSFSTLSLSLS
ncbi:hypothetical protein MHH56_15630 [Paenibacillus sp. FSL K6-3182]|uniref:hypothetical protein n=1 Tax=Paenibacillus sp. FSL K6-3182 TaxID=2921495 RepID=UPI0030CBD5AE